MKIIKLVAATLMGVGSLCLSSNAHAQTVLLGDHLVDGNLEVGTVANKAGLTIIGQTGTGAQPGFKVTGDGGVLFEGNYGTGTIPATGPGGRLMWYPKKAAFRVGYLDSSAGWGSEWNDSVIGYNSVAFGNSSARGAVSVAMNGGIAYGEYSTAISSGLAEGDFSTAMTGGVTMGNQSTAIGYGTTIESFGAIVLGSHNVPDAGTPTSWVETDPILIIGNGTGDSNDPPEVRNRNALVIRKNGDLEINGKIKMFRQGDILMGEFGEP